MKNILFPAIAVLVVVMNLDAQVNPNILIYPGISDNSPDYMCRSYFAMVTSVGNDYLYCSELEFSHDSVTTDALNFHCALFDMIRVRQISFSRNGHDYLSADSFPVKDSAVWKLERSKRDSLVLKDSLLYFKLFNPRQGTRFSWSLKEKHTFRSGDTFKLLLDEKPGIYSKIMNLPRSRPPGETNIVSKQANKLVLVEPGLSSSEFHDRSNRTVFDLQGRMRLASTGGPTLLIMQPVKNDFMSSHYLKE